jgi:hypothetical protein
MIFKRLEETGIKIVDDESLNAFIDFILERVNKAVDNSKHVRTEFKERVKFKIYQEVHKV